MGVLFCKLVHIVQQEWLTFPQRKLFIPRLFTDLSREGLDKSGLVTEPGYMGISSPLYHLPAFYREQDTPLHGPFARPSPGRCDDRDGNL